ncbi:MAG: DUF6468 domain-containing protein [Pseudomonadota bacterium]
MTISLLLDGFLILLLGATLVYAARLSRRLSGLRKDREVLEKVLSDFSAATQRAEESVYRLKTIADVSSKELQRQTDLARSLRDDLAFLSDRGEIIADRLTDSVRSGGKGKAGETAEMKIKPVTSVPGHRLPRGQMRSKAERELIEALQAVR